MRGIEAELINRLETMMRCRCKLAARVRIRDLARLYAGYGVCSYEEKYNELKEKYNP